MSEWFRTAFGSDYTELYAHRNAGEAAQAVDLILSKTGLKPGARALDAPCGAGRHLRAFRNRGMRAFGFDLSLDLLKQVNIDNANPLPIVRADLRALPFQPGRFDLVVNLFSSLGYFPDDETNLSVLCQLVSLCAPGGWVVIDFMNSQFVRANLAETSERATASGAIIHDKRWIAGSPARVNKHTRVAFPDGTEKTFEESVRLFTPDELRRALTDCGAAIEMEFGDYAGEPFTADSQRLILMGKRL